MLVYLGNEKRSRWLERLVNNYWLKNGTRCRVSLLVIRDGDKNTETGLYEQKEISG